MEAKELHDLITPKGSMDIHGPRPMGIRHGTCALIATCFQNLEPPTHLAVLDPEIKPFERLIFPTIYSSSQKV